MSGGWAVARCHMCLHRELSSLRGLHRRMAGPPWWDHSASKCNIIRIRVANSLEQSLDRFVLRCASSHKSRFQHTMLPEHSPVESFSALKTAAAISTGQFVLQGMRIRKSQMWLGLFLDSCRTPATMAEGTGRESMNVRRFTHR